MHSGKEALEGLCDDAGNAFRTEVRAWLQQHWSGARKAAFDARDFHDREFDASFARVKDAGLAYFAGPHREGPGEINHHWGGRGVYFEDPDGHLLELITKPYGELPPG